MKKGNPAFVQKAEVRRIEDAFDAPNDLRGQEGRAANVALANLDHFAGGREESDGVIYAYPHQDARRLLKIMAIPVQEQHRGLFCLDERLKFMRFLGENDAPIAFPHLSPQGNSYETFAFESHLWVGYSMEIAPGKNVPAEA
jgi:hypothetical protein